MGRLNAAAVFFLILLCLMILFAPQQNKVAMEYVQASSPAVEMFQEVEVQKEDGETQGGDEWQGGQMADEVTVEGLDVQDDKRFDMDDGDTIFVSVASYRDAMCPTTVKSLYENAKRPDLISVGLCQQNDPLKDVDCAINDDIKPEWRARIRTVRVAHHDAMGPTWARYLCSTMLQDEKYYLQIDSHCFFAKDWDAKLVRMIKQLKAKGVKKPMLSHYTKAHDAYDDPNDDKSSVPTICKSFFNENKMISFEGADFVTVKPGDLPRPNPYVAAGMMFGPSEFAREVPFDPNLPYLFVGEEILHSVRLWTHGWDIFTPNENVIYHYYTRESEPKYWNDAKYNDDSAAVNKVRWLLELEDAQKLSPLMSKNLDVYGLGKERTLNQYFEFAGIEKTTQKVNTDFCKDPDVFERWEKFKVVDTK